MTPWKVDPVRRCRHTVASCPGPETPAQNCGQSIFRHVGSVQFVVGEPHA